MLEMMTEHTLGIAVIGTAMLLKILAGLLIGGGAALKVTEKVQEHGLKKKQLAFEEKKFDVGEESKKAFLKQTREDTEKKLGKATAARREERTFQSKEASMQRQSASGDRQTALMMQAIASIAANVPKTEVAEPLSLDSSIYNLIRR